MYYEIGQPIVARAAESERASFIRRTYAHLAGAILAFVALEFLLFNMFSSQQLAATMVSFFSSPVSQLILLAAFIGVGYLARWWAYQGGSLAMQYAGLALYVVFEAFIFIPILYVAVYYTRQPNIIPTAAILTLAMFAGLTVAAFITRKDFSFLGPILSVAGFLMLGVVLVAILLPNMIGLGLWFSFLGVALASAYILYDTSNVIHHFRTDQHVAASLELFSSVAYLFYHILRILILTGSNRN